MKPLRKSPERKEQEQKLATSLRFEYMWKQLSQRFADADHTTSVRDIILNFSNESFHTYFAAYPKDLQSFKDGHLSNKLNRFFQTLRDLYSALQLQSILREYTGTEDAQRITQFTYDPYTIAMDFGTDKGQLLNEQPNSARFMEYFLANVFTSLNGKISELTYVPEVEHSSPQLEKAAEFLGTHRSTEILRAESRIGSKAPKELRIFDGYILSFMEPTSNWHNALCRVMLIRPERHARMMREHYEEYQDIDKYEKDGSRITMDSLPESIDMTILANGELAFTYADGHTALRMALGERLVPLMKHIMVKLGELVLRKHRFEELMAILELPYDPKVPSSRKQPANKQGKLPSENIQKAYLNLPRRTERTSKRVMDNDPEVKNNVPKEGVSHIPGHARLLPYDFRPNLEALELARDARLALEVALELYNGEKTRYMLRNEFFSWLEVSGITEEEVENDIGLLRFDTFVGKHTRARKHKNVERRF